MTQVLVLGAGKIGRMIVRLLADGGDYTLRVGDVSQEALDRLAAYSSVETMIVDASDASALAKAMAGCRLVISALSFRSNPAVARAALKAGISYFDLTEDVETTRQIRAITEKAGPTQVFVPQCGLAPGFISIVAHHLTRWFEKVDTLHMRVGALPQFPTNALKYNLTWSTDGLINEYCNPCEAIHEGKTRDVLPLEGLEQFSLDGVRYEAFNTSGGLGTLCETMEGKVRELNYKTVRYVGHRDLMQVLLSELRLSERRDLLKDILESAIPIIYQDVVVILCTATGWRHGQLVQLNDARKIYWQEICGEVWSAIQILTAAGVCAVVDLFLAGATPTQGFVRQEQIDFQAFVANRFGKHYETKDAPRFHYGGFPKEVPNAQRAD